jgi:hypothetical protein
LIPKTEPVKNHSADNVRTSIEKDWLWTVVAAAYMAWAKKGMM